MRRMAGLPDRSIGWLTARADYLAFQNSKKWITPYFILQVRPQGEDAACAYRVGFTASRKVGKATVRNRARRRLRELARLHLPQQMQPGYDLVFIARYAAAIAPFTNLVETLAWALKRLDVNEEQP